MASNPGQIPAGGKDKISVVVHTGNRGGGSLTKRFRVTTNDSQAPQTQLVVTGKVQALIEISPKRVKIVGYIGDKDLFQDVKIESDKEHRFSVKEVKANNGAGGIIWDLKPLGKEPPEKGYLLRVACNKEAAGRSYDVLLVKTDSKDKPTLRIPVSCNVYKKPDANIKKPDENANQTGDVQKSKQ